ncbi:MAG: Hsp20/alpha crystallin family protein [Phaeodactylibacter sp.]|nr:Hsp20/alpha crystallin family protein [Phaeodactylibacter sp.]MCB9275033.1 Hsp20/alpha crystallin family protein [Lewinellaceae bacterium]
MKPVKYNPFLPKSVNTFFDDVFNRGLGDFFGRDFFISEPSVNVVETKDSYRIEVAAPGLDKGDFKVEAEKGYLKISASKEQKEEVKEGDYMRREFNYNSFSRSFELPGTVDADNITANYENGVLLISVPKKEEAKVEHSRVIEIK